MEDLLTLDKKVMTANYIKDQDVANCIETCVIDKNYWIDKKQIADVLEIPIDDLQDLLKNSQSIVINKEGKLTTRKLYKEKTSFLDKLLDSLKNRID
ncbi:hypothetical protein [Psychroserpens sp.]